MAQLILKQEIVEMIKDDAILYGKVAHSLGITAPSLRAVLKANNIKLTQIGVIRILKEHLGITKDSDLLTELQEPAILDKRTLRSKQKQVA